MDRKYALSYILVDDDEDDRFFLREALSQASRPLPIYEFCNGQELLDYLTYNSSIRDDKDVHWLLIIDINMPIMDGLETIGHIRSNPVWQDLPILVLSTSAQPETVDAALRAGAIDYRVKPNTFREYVELLDEFFSPWLEKST